MPAAHRPVARRVAALASSGAALLWLLLPAGTSSAQTQTQTVGIVDFSFSPATVQVPMGPAEIGFPTPHAHVLFVNNSPETTHNVAFSGGAQSSPSLGPNGFYDAIFLAAGTFAYHCSIHPAMQGSVTVTPLPTTTTTTTTAPPTTEAPTTAPPTTGAPASTTTTRPRTTTTRPAGGAATSTTTTAPSTTTAAPDTTAAPATEPASTTTTPSTTDVGDGLAATTRSPPPGDSPRSPVAVLLVVLGAGISVFAARALWLRRQPPSDEH